MPHRMPPHNKEAEESLLGCFILNPGTFENKYNLEKEDFYYKKNSEIFSALEALYNKGDAIDLTTLTDMLEKQGTLEKVGGVNYIVELMQKATTFNVKEYSKIIKDLSITRSLIQASNEIIDEAFNHHENINELLTEAESKIYNLSHTESDRKNLKTISSVMLKSLFNIHKATVNRGKLTGITSGFVDLDKITNGFQKSDLIIIAARPSMGKTAFALNIATNAALYHSKKVLIFSLEMSAEQLGQRMILSEALVDGDDVRTGNLSSNKWDAIEKTSNRIANSPLCISDSPTLTVPDISSVCRKKKLEDGIDLIIIDYMQLMKSTTRTENRQNEISEISRSLKQLAREMECPVICLSQLARGPESRTDKRPLLSDLRDSGSIEQDADIVMFLFREAYYDKDKNPYIAELNVAKHRNGPTGVIKLSWLAKYARFSNYTEEEADEGD